MALRIQNSMTPKAYPVKQKPVKDSTLNIKHVFAQKGETYHTIAKRYHIPFGLIYVYNDVDRHDRQPYVGDVVFLQAKNNVCETFDTHIVKKGESMHDISQQYGIKLINLYDLNGMDYNTVPKVGQILKLK